MGFRRADKAETHRGNKVGELYGGAPLPIETNIPDLASLRLLVASALGPLQDSLLMPGSKVTRTSGKANAFPIELTTEEYLARERTLPEAMPTETDIPALVEVWQRVIDLTTQHEGREPEDIQVLAFARPKSCEAIPPAE